MAIKPVVRDTRNELIASQRKAWGDTVQLCNMWGCDKDAAIGSCYCIECEQKIGD